MSARVAALLLVVGAWLVLSGRAAHAHTVSNGLLTLTFPRDQPRLIQGRWDVVLDDLDAAFSFPRRPDGGISTDAVRAREKDIAGLLFSNLALRADGEPCPIAGSDLDLVDHDGVLYVRMPFSAECPDVPSVVDIDYTLFFDREGPLPPHRGLVRIKDGVVERSAIMSSAFRHERFTRSGVNRPHELRTAIANGIAHIASGTDHILFLLALLLPSVLRRDGPSLSPVESFSPAALEVAKTVTAFTVAHSITLSLSALDVLRIPSRIVEPAIAASVVTAALLNLRPPSRLRLATRWQVAFALGLLHGFGFSAALMDLGLAGSALVVPLLGFNLGVEIGQLFLVALFLPLAYLARRTEYYRPIALVGGSVVIALVASVWVVQRVLV